ncbi:MAG: phospholipase D-like domain-containing protein, partial [Terriglobales bacterium]
MTEIKTKSQTAITACQDFLRLCTEIERLERRAHSTWLNTAYFAKERAECQRRIDLLQSDLSVASSIRRKANGTINESNICARLLDARMQIKVLEACSAEHSSKIAGMQKEVRAIGSRLVELNKQRESLVRNYGFDSTTIAAKLEQLRSELEEHSAMPSDMEPEPVDYERWDDASDTYGLLVNEEKFFSEFANDVRTATKVIEIFCPFLRKRAHEIIPQLSYAVERGVKVRLYTKLLEEEEREDRRKQAEGIVKDAKQAGIHVTHIESMHQKVAIIDDIICWEGSLNILSHFSTREMMRRLVGTK